MQEKNRRYQKLLFGYTKDEQRSLDHCLYCFENIHHKETFIHYIKKQDILCASCRQQMQEVNQIIDVKGLKIYAIYKYDDYLEKLLFQFKEANDIALAAIFVKHLKKSLEHKYRKYTWVFMPSNHNKIKERGFYPLKELFKDFKINEVELLYKNSEYKQSAQPLNKRGMVKNIIALKDHPTIHTKILLVDDVCTSGESLKAAYELLSSIYEVEIMVVAIHELNLKKDNKCENSMNIWEMFKKMFTRG